jgi:polyhydroxyalkanoate synthesis regulator phasin
MKIHPSTLVVPLAVVLLVIGAGAVLATSGPSAPGTAPAPAAATPTPGATTAPAPATAPGANPGGPAAGPFVRPLVDDTALKTALDKLVAAGTITAAQEQAILDAVKAERQARVDELQAQRDALRAQRDQIRQFLADGQITQDELDQLPADSPLRQLTSLMADGKITADELRQLGRDLFPAIGRGRGFGLFGPHKGGQPDASASPSATTGG